MRNCASSRDAMRLLKTSGDSSPCDWASYGLFRGPVIVIMKDGKEVPIFDFDGRPFTPPPIKKPRRRRTAAKAVEAR